MTLIDKYATILRLRSSIAAQETASRALRSEIVTLAPQGPLTGPARSGLWQEKRALGATTRTMLLALAMVRGRAYARVEQHPRTPFSASIVAMHVLGTTSEALYDSRNLADAVEMRSAVNALAREIDAWTKAAEAPCVVTAPAEVVAAAHA